MGFNLASPFHASAERVPNRVALEVDGQTFTYAELRERVRAVAATLGEHGAGARVAIFSRRSLDTYLGILGTLWAGGTYVPLNPTLPEDRLARMLETTRAKAIVTDSENLARLTPRLRRDAAVIVPSQLAPSAATSPRPTEVSQAHVAYVEFTSGTTGFPKGVLVPSRAVEAFLSACRTLFPATELDRFAAMSEITFDLSVFDMFSAWDRGAALHVLPAGQVMMPLGFLQQRAITVMLTVPSTAAMLTRMKLLRPGALPDLRVSLFCGEPLPLTSAHAWAAAAPNSELHNIYGPTEATVACSHQRYVGDATPSSRGIMTIGVPFPGTELAVLSENRSFVAARGAGELAIAGAQLADGYDQDDEKTAQKFVTVSGKRWYLTGDRAERDAEGRFFHLGRVDHQVKVLGMRVELEDIEAHLRQVFETAGVAAVAWPTRNGSAEGIVAFVCAPDLAPQLPELRKRLRERLPAPMVPTAVHLVERLPLNANGKVDRAGLVATLDAPPT
jgi:amino acid adenylation domain-containing protein